MERALKKVQDKDINDIFDFIFQNSLGNPIIFTATPTAAGMKANTWGKVKDVNTDIYLKFGDGGAMKITGTELA